MHRTFACRIYAYQPQMWTIHRTEKAKTNVSMKALLMGSAVLIPCYSTGLAFDSSSRSPQLKPFRITTQLVHSAGEKTQAYDVDDDLRAMCEEGQLKDAVSYFELVHKGGLKSTPGNYSFLLQECAKVKALAEGLKVHSLLIRSGLKIDVFLNNNLLSMYMRCGRSSEAWDLFDAMRGNRDVVTWTLMIDAYGQKGELKEAFRLFDRMLQKRVRPNKITFVCMLKACNSPEAITNGKLIHRHIVKRCLERNIHVGYALVDMYLKCGSISDARKAFNKVPKPHDALWNVMIYGYVRDGKNEDALKVFELMCRAKVEPSEKTLATTMKACSNHSALPHAMWLHSCIYQIKSEMDDYLGHHLVEMYINCGSIEDAHNVYVRMPSQMEISWNSLIAGDVYVQA